MLVNGAIQFMMTTIQPVMRTQLQEDTGKMIFQMNLGTVAPPVPQSCTALKAQRQMRCPRQEKWEQRNSLATAPLSDW